MVIIGFAMGNYSYAQEAFSENDREICSYMVSLAERAKRMPPGLLQSIALIESGRYVEGQVTTSWPWTVSTPEGGRFFQNKQRALKAIAMLKDEGKSNIDIGCMQINLFYHGRGFASVDEALDPVNNVAYAAEFLTLLYRRYGSWGEAVKYYHSSDPQKNSYYLEKVIAAWQRLGENRNSPYIAELKKALDNETKPPLPPTEESETAIAKSTLNFADELRRRVSSIENEATSEDLDGYNDQLRIWDEWQPVLEEGTLQGKSPDYYIKLFDDTF